MKINSFLKYGYRILILLIILIHHPLHAQTNKHKQLNGVVRDNLGPLPGVVVQVLGTNMVTLTNIEGKYSINVDNNETLIFSFQGYLTQQIIIENKHRPILNITLAVNNKELDEIIVNAGYYSVKDKQRTGSIARVTSKDIEFQPITNPLQALQGRMAGVSITQNSGTPGGGFDIKIRGRNSLRTMMNSEIDGNQPLYIVDGVPLVDNDMKRSGLSTQILNSYFNPLNSINPNDIESIDILKDADATAIYGSKGANGVILVTTKQAKSIKTQFTLSSSTSFSTIASKMKLMNTQEFNKMRDEAFSNDHVTQYPANAYDVNGAWDRNRYTDWQKEFIGKTAIAKDINLGISGGNQYTKFKINTSHVETTTVFPTDKGYKRNNILLQLNHQSKDQRFLFNSSFNYAIQSNDLPAIDLTRTALELAPNAPELYQPDGTLNWQSGTFMNPLAQLEKTYSSNTKNLIFNANLSYNIFKNTYIKLNTGLTNSIFNEKTLTPHTMYNPSLGYTSEMSSAEKATNNFESYIIEPQLNWFKSFNKHSINILVGSTYQAQQGDYFKITGSNFSSNILIDNIGAAKNKMINQVSDSQYKYAAVFGRINYNYNDKYIVNLTGRRDGSSRFGPGKKYGNFGAIGIAWLFSNEKWFKDISWLNHGKLRSSYGITGSDQIGDYIYLDTYSVNNQKYDEIIGLTPSRLFNPDFSWEKTKKFEIALELGMLNNRINTSIAWYRNRTSNQLVGLPLPINTGFYSVQANLDATIQNTGVELTLNTKNITDIDWSWTTNFNLSVPKNKLISFPNLEGSTYANSFVVGESTNIVKLYNYLGLNPQTGLYQFTDYNQDSKFSIEDKKAIRQLGPIFYGGLQNTISYKNFSLDFLFQFVKQDNYNYNSSFKRPGTLFNQPVQMNDRWSVDNPNAQYAFASNLGNNTLNQLSVLVPQSTMAVSDASYIRLKNIAISYYLSIPKAKIEMVKFYLQGQNLWTITNYFGMDPEFVYPGALPPLKTYAFGVQLTF